jgi:hyperosmotically inducible periplasmic protein
MAKLRLLAAAVATSLSFGFAVAGALADDATQARSDQPVTDSYLTTKVKAEVALDKDIDSGDIHVTTKNGVVELSGTVGTVTEKLQAAADARKVKGIVDVQNDLTLSKVKSP